MMVRRHPNKQFLVLGGRLRSKVSQVLPICLFFAVSRGDASTANLTMDYAKALA